MTIETKSIRWGWCQPNLPKKGVQYNEPPSVQCETFSTVDEATTSMSKRLGNSTEPAAIIETMERIGVHLCRVEVTTKVLTILQ